MKTNSHPDGKSVQNKPYQDLEFEDFISNDSDDDALENKSLSQIEDEYYSLKENPRPNEIRNWDNT